MAVIHRKQKWLFLCEPHTASRATIKLLFPIGGRTVGSHHAGLQHLRDENLTDFDIICAVRNPLDVLVTKYLRHNIEGVAFNLWVDRHFNNPIVKEPMRGLWRQANTFVYYENLQEDLRWVFRRTDINGQDFTLQYDRDHKTRGKTKPWREFMDDAMFKRLTKHYRSFLEEFGYDIDYDGKTRLDPSRVVDRCRQLRYHKP